MKNLDLVVFALVGGITAILITIFEVYLYVRFTGY